MNIASHRSYRGVNEEDAYVSCIEALSGSMSGDMLLGRSPKQHREATGSLWFEGVLVLYVYFRIQLIFA